MQTYPKEQVDALLLKYIDFAKEALALAKHHEERANTATANIVSLEKVASADQARLAQISPDAIKPIVERLLDYDMMEPQPVEKVAAYLSANPEQLLRIIPKILEISAQAPAQGMGIPKTASADEPPFGDTDGWIIRKAGVA